jgi:3-phosphoshikimate 1-carboxyvinyltransferase
MMMDIKIKNAGLSGAVKAIASKSHVHRLLICAALADDNTCIDFAETSDDINATLNCLKSLQNNQVDLDCGESGTTLRLLLPVSLALGVQARFYMRGRLPKRPLYPLDEQLELHGCKLDNKGASPLICGGRLTNGEFNLPGNISSQFISGLLLALPIVHGDSVIKIEGQLQSKDYVSMTIRVMEQFGVIVGRGFPDAPELMPENGVASTENGASRMPHPTAWYIQGGQKYISPGRIQAEGDWSNAAFWLCAGAIGKPVTCTGLDFTSSQGDKAVVDILRQFGANVSCESDNVTVSRGNLRGIKTGIDAGDIPDLVPVLAVVAAASEGQTVIRNAERLRLKESDRLEAITLTLKNLGADIRETGDGLIITGHGGLSGGRVDSFNDHRIAMSAAIASIICADSVEISNAQAVNKSYPEFFEHFKKLGGEWEEI